MVQRRKDSESAALGTSLGPPATTPELREQQMTALAYDLVEKRLRDGTATSQESTFFLRLGTEESKLQKEKLRKENILLEARTEQLSKNDRMESLFEDAIKAFKGYSGEEVPPDDLYED
jgi:hypothetical protein